MNLGLRTRTRHLFQSLVGAERLATRALTLPVGQINLDEARFLSSLVAALDTPGPIVEVGTLFGFSTRVMVLAKTRGRRLITVDNYGWNPLGLSADAHRRSTAEILDEAVHSHDVEIVCCDKNEFYRTYSGPGPSLVFLDAVHTYDETKKDIEWARRAGAEVICLHDYGPRHPGVVRAVDEIGGPERVEGTLAVLTRGARGR